MRPGQTALEVNCVRRTDGAVSREFHGAALDECAGRHDYLRFITGHIAGNGGGKAVHRRGGLDALTEGNHAFLTAQFHRLNNVVTAFGGVGNAFKAQGLVKICGKDCTLFRIGGDGGGEEEALIHLGHKSEVCAHFLAQSGSGKAVSAAVDAGLCAGNVTAGGSKTAARILDEAAYNHICTHFGGLQCFHKFTVAVIHHDDDVRLNFLAESD